MAKKRADIYLVESGIVESREKARELIDEGKVFADRRLVFKPSTLLEEGIHLEVESRPPYVSRGGIKLEKAIHLFNIDIRGKDALDVGVGTGGFTDCLLKHGAATVIAVDVGYGQVAWSIRTDPRVTLFERTNFRDLSANELPRRADVATVDLSFISVKKIFDKLAELVKPRGELVILAKPQFEAGREFVGKKGIVRDQAVHRRVLTELVEFVNAGSAHVKGITCSPIKGAKGNVEFLIYAVFERCETPVDWSDRIRGVVESAHRELK
ncbi:MAG: TlyA family RNA methyltransferase [Actinobacteria bacterium]|nr:TlyA family RNA methyltransferase [Actinomycetota bacterium]